jgi:hypothetical protein
MLQLLLMLAAAPPMNGVPDRVIFRDPQNGPTPVTDLWIIPPKLADCRTAQEEEVALDHRRHGEMEQCAPRTKAENRRR